MYYSVQRATFDICLQNIFVCFSQKIFCEITCSNHPNVPFSHTISETFFPGFTEKFQKLCTQISNSRSIWPKQISEHIGTKLHQTLLVQFPCKNKWDSCFLPLSKMYRNILGTFNQNSRKMNLYLYKNERIFL